MVPYKPCEHCNGTGRREIDYRQVFSEHMPIATYDFHGRTRYQLNPWTVVGKYLTDSGVVTDSGRKWLIRELGKVPNGLKGLESLREAA